MTPQFICIGAPKAGTTWLYRQLALHPGVWVPPVKELHYFDRKFPIDRVAKKKGAKSGLFGIYKSYGRGLIMHVIARALSRAAIGDLVWAHRYFGSQLSDEWYMSLFERAHGRVSGEFTTDYCALSADAVEHIYRMLPKLKVIFLLRNPIDRSWSHARMLLPELLAKPLESITEAEFVDYLCHPAAKRKSQYARTLEIWEQRYPKEQMLVGFYDDIATKPEALLKCILGFVGVETDIPSVLRGVHKKVNIGKGKSAMPENIYRILANEYMDELTLLSRRFDGYATTWLEAASGVTGVERSQHIHDTIQV